MRKNENYNSTTIFTVSDTLGLIKDDASYNLNFCDDRFAEMEGDRWLELCRDICNELIDANVVRAIDGGDWFTIYRDKLIPIKEICTLLQEDASAFYEFVANNYLYVVCCHKEIQTHHWDFNFIKLSSYINTSVSIYGSHDDCNSFMYQSYDQGEYDEGYISHGEEGQTIEPGVDWQNISEGLYLYDILENPNKFI